MLRLPDIASTKVSLSSEEIYSLNDSNKNSSDRLSSPKRAAAMNAADKRIGKYFSLTYP